MINISFKKVNFIYYFAFYLFFSGCDNDPKMVYKNTTNGNGISYKIKIIDTFILKVPVDIPIPHWFNSPNDNSYGFSYSYSNIESQTIIECDVVNKNWKVHTFNFEGPNGIKGISSFFITDNRDILIFPLVSNDIFVYDTDDNPINKFKYNEVTWLRGTSFKNHCYYKNNIILFPSAQYSDFKKFGKSKLIKKINLINKTEENIVPVPKDFYQYHSDNSYDQSPEFVFPNDSIIVFIMRKSPNIYIYNISTKETKYYHYPNENIIYDESDIAKSHNDLDYNNIKGFYHSIIYDKGKRYYYRFSQFNKIKNEYSLKSTRIRIDVFDENISLIASADFNNLFPSYAFAIKNKLYVATLKDKENIINFVVFSVNLRDKK
jgi:hypothetical protein